MALGYKTAQGMFPRRRLSRTPSGVLIDEDLLTLSSGVITDAVRAAGVQGDGLIDDSSVGVYIGIENLVSNPTNLAHADWHVYSSGGAITSGIDDPLGGNTAFRLAVGTSPNFYGRFQEGTLSINTTYTTSVWLRAALPNGASVFLGIDDGAFSSVVPVTNAWQRFEATKTTSDPVPVGGRDFQIVAQGGDAPFALDIWWPQSESLPFATPFTPTNRTDALISVPPALIDIAQGWFCARLRPHWQGSTMTAFPSILELRDNAGTGAIQMFHNAGSWYTQVVDGTGADLTQLVADHDAFDTLTILGTWTASQLGVSKNGGALVTAAHARSPGPAVSFNIGQQPVGASFIMGEVYGAAWGAGPVTNADAAIIASLVEQDASPVSYPASVQVAATWSAETASILKVA